MNATPTCSSIISIQESITRIIHDLERYGLDRPMVISFLVDLNKHLSNLDLSSTPTETQPPIPPDPTTLEGCSQLAAQAWTYPPNTATVMDEDLARRFAKILHIEVLKSRYDM